MTRLSKADHDIDVLAASTIAEIQEQTTRFEADPDACSKSAFRTCVTAPHGTAINPYIVVTVNGSEMNIPIGGTVRDALKAAGISRAENVLSRLKLRRRYTGRLVSVDFDRMQPDILGLLLSGNEDVSW